MITWIRENTGIFSLAASAILVISAAAVGWNQLSGLVEQQPEIQRHLYDSSRHVDPEEKKRMEERIDSLESRLRELESHRWRQHIDRQRGRNRRQSRLESPSATLQLVPGPKQPYRLLYGVDELVEINRR